MTFSKRIFAMILLPTQTRKNQLKFVEQFEEILTRYEDEKDRKVLSQYYVGFDDPSKNILDNLFIKINNHPKWYDKRFTDVLKIMKNLSFFKRFSVNRIREMMDVLDLDILRPKQMLFMQKDKVYVIVSGCIQMKSHKKNTELPDTLAKFGEGDILNFL